MNVPADRLRVPREPPLGRRAGIDLFDALGTTRSIRRFTDEPVSTDDLATLLYAASRAPTGSNRQNVRWVVLRREVGGEVAAARAALAGAARRVWADKRAADGYHRGSGEDPTSPKARMARVMDDFVDGFDRIPVVLLPCLIRHRAPTPTEGGSVYPAVQNLLLAARGLGLGGVLTMWHGLVEDELRTGLQIPADVGIAATIGLGHPVGGHGPVQRRPLNDIVFDGPWGEPAPWAQDP